MKRQIIFSLVLGSLVSCADEKNRKQPEISNDTEKSTETAPADFDVQDSLSISVSCAVFYQPDSAKIFEIQKTTPPEQLATALDDHNYYMQQARMKLEEAKISIRNFEGSYLQFRKADSTVSVIRVDLLPFAWGLILFNGIDNPSATSLTDMEPEIERFLKGK